MKFPYEKRSYRNPAGQTFRILRPVIPVGIRYQRTRLRAKYGVLVDSGADNCILHAEIGEQIGVDVKAGQPKTFEGVGFGSTTGY